MVVEDKKSVNEERYSLTETSSDWEMPQHMDHPVVGEKLNALKVVVWSLGIVADGVGIWRNIGSNFYYYNLGKNMTGLLTKLFVLFDHALNTNVIVPAEPWLRYN